MGAPEPPPVLDPDLQTLTFDQLAQLVEEVSPDAFYERAAAFDTAMARFEQLQDDLGAQTRHLWEAWSGRIAEAFDEVVREVSGRTGAVVHAMADPGYGAVLRRAGDALTQARQRVHDLRAQNRQGDLEAARQVLYDLGTAYRDLVAVLTPVPGAGTEVPSTSNPPGGVPAGGEPQTGPGWRPSGQEQYPSGGGAAGGGFAPSAALAHPGVQGRIARAAGVEPGSAPAAPSGGAVVLGRTVAPAPAAGSAQAETDAVAAAVLGRPSVGRKETARPGRGRRKEVLGEKSDGCAPEPGRDDEPASATEKVPTTSAPEGEHAREAAPRAAKTIEAVAEPTAHAAPVTAAAPAGHGAASTASAPLAEVAPSEHVAPKVASAPAVHAAAAPAGHPAPGVASAPAGHLAPASASAAQVAPAVHGASVTAPGVPAAPAPGTPAAPALPATAPAAPAFPATPTAAGPAFPTAPAASGHGPLPGSPSPGGFGGHEPAAGVPRGPGALPASPAFQPVSGSLDATAAGVPPVGPGVPGSPRVAGDHSAAGGYLGSAFPGAAGQEPERERDPAKFLEVEPGAWTSGADGAPVLGRPVAAPPPAGPVPAEVAELERLKDPEELKRVLGRLGRRDEE
ncbi:hypothetical protein Q5425_44700 [Amycolatopsis sp. A133]|uniref:hypothetical protein n=1 Tax=Amycolatopsis sp. A133 TaxID=3064472 RepID=UPI0027F8C64D|nr:hypothetical protein [Amycolatopsis sp. A133]MDQ7810867.1 hypothetical protein [Amycolatopsis sp. A133]